MGVTIGTKQGARTAASEVEEISITPLFHKVQESLVRGEQRDLESLHK